MRILSRYALNMSAAAVLLAGCGALSTAQNDTPAPIRAPGTVPQSRASNYKVVYAFTGSHNGHGPYAGLIGVNGTLYGTTLHGGTQPDCSFGCGTVFSVTSSGTEKVLHEFSRSGDGFYPLAGLIDVGGTLYGTTSSGGDTIRGCYSCGTVFSITPSGTEKELYEFGAKRDGNLPVASLIEVNGTLYGTTEDGGAHQLYCGQCGTVFSITPSGNEKVLHRFGEAGDGHSPLASLIEVKGELYGTTEYGGAYGLGTVFSITLSGTEKVLHSFGSGSDGALPAAGLVDVGGTLYGTTEYGGSPDCNSSGRCGTVFSITPSGTEKVLHAFTGGTDGAAPAAPLIAANDTLYGTTEYGGEIPCDIGGSCGTVFSITPSGTEKVLHAFGGESDGRYPMAGLVDVDGTLYGTTAGGGGKNGSGTVFSLTL